MERGKRVASLFALALMAAGYAPARGAGQGVVAVDLDAPFVLAVGETARAGGPDGLGVTLRSATEDSGCLAPDDCSLMLFEGTLALAAGEARQLAQLNVSFYPHKPYTMTFGGYEVQVLAVHRANSRTEVTFQVVQAPPEPEEEKKAEER